MLLTGTNVAELDIHQHLVMESYAVPITYFSRRMELLECLIDVINAHCEIIGQGILHCDISLNNIMIYFEYTINGIFARGLLIDYNYATKISKGTDHAVGRQDLTGTLMFMASGILLQYSEHGIPCEQMVAHDLESFVHVFIYICVMYDGPGDKLRDDKLFNQTIISQWIYREWDTIGLIKQQHMEQPDLIISDITPYFQPFLTLITKLCLLLSEQVNCMKTFDSCGTTPTINSPLTHTRLINTIWPAIDDDNYDEPLSVHMCIRQLVFDGKAPSFITEGDRPYLASKAKRSGAILDNQCSSKRWRTTSGVRRLLNSGTAHPIRATRGNSTRQSRRHHSGLRS
ncbi:uncharacterized protein EDB93DRAFT_1095804 [Suillus bovinus]|uniref:uncharacterized protein n=1 Tax=Suillus bovinus TaxID=48563 RepID=UPI001B87A551|nr:uncharacterized protein EDB93DRAFT_1095804 [Suillus bovinus]KAG2128897.1 hypothetical protein EDB93DRAFT_1095804 [Suillus bovinus]